jgi:hypothetical protein
MRQHGAPNLSLAKESMLAMPGDGASEDDPHLFHGQLACLVGGKLDVLVVGQDQHVVGRQVLKGVKISCVLGFIV